VAFGPFGLLLLAVLDSSGLPVANTLDAYLIFLAIKDPSRVYWYAAISVAGSTIGNVILFQIARRGGARFLRESAGTGRAQRFRRWFERFGLVTVFVPALMPIPMPLKLFVISAGVLRTRLITFVIVILAARIPRYFGESWLGVKLGQESTGFLRDHVWHFVFAAILIFASLCLVVLAAERWHSRRAHVR